MKNNPTRSERREIERLRKIGLSDTNWNLSVNKNFLGLPEHKKFVLKTYLNITVIPLIFTGILHYMSLTVKSIVFLGDTSSIVAILFSICLGLTVSFTAALIICEPIPITDTSYKSIVKLVTIIIFLLFLSMVAHSWSSL